MSFNIPYGSTTSGGGITMPQCTVLAANLKLKQSLASAPLSTQTSFYTNGLELDHTAVGWDAAVLSHAANTTEQTIIDISGASGVLTNVMSPRIASASGTMTIRITADGVLTTFTDVLVTANSSILLLGDRVHTVAQTAATSAVGYGSGGDHGWDITPQSTLLLTPVQVIEKGLFGMPFTDSLKVTIQGSANLTATSTSHKSAVTYALDIPQGL